MYLSGRLRSTAFLSPVIASRFIGAAISLCLWDCFVFDSQWQFNSRLPLCKGSWQNLRFWLKDCFNFQIPSVVIRRQLPLHFQGEPFFSHVIASRFIGVAISKNATRLLRHYVPRNDTPIFRIEPFFIPNFIYFANIIFLYKSFICWYNNNSLK